MASFNLTLSDYRFKTTEGKRIDTMKIQTSLVVTQEEIDRRDSDPDWHFDHLVLRSREAASRYLDKILMELFKGNTLSSGVISDIERPLRFCYPSEQSHYRNELTKAGIIKH